MDEKKGVKRRKFIKNIGKGILAAYVAPTITSFALSENAEATHSREHEPGRGHRGQGRGRGRISPHPGLGKGRGKRRDKEHR